jgi:hypothetical protein
LYKEHMFFIQLLAFIIENIAMIQVKRTQL